MPVASWRIAGGGMLGLMAAVMDRSLSTTERVIVRLWLVGAVVVMALTGFAVLLPDGSVVEGASVGEMRSALDSALAAAIAGAVYSLLSLAIFMKAIASARDATNPAASPSAAGA